jgi:type II secretion system protein C
MFCKAARALKITFQLRSPIFWSGCYKKFGFRMKKRLNLIQRSFCVLVLVLFGLLYFSTMFLSAFQSPESSNYRNYFSGMTLIGVIISENNESSAAIFMNKNSGEMTVLRVGETILDLELLQVLKNRIIFKKGEDSFQIFLGKGNIANVKRQASSIPPALPEPETESQIQAETESSGAVTKEFSRAEMEKRLEDEWALLLQETRFIPNLEDGEIKGFKITQMSDKSLLYEIGVRTDDIIKEVNGVKLDNLQTVMSLYDKFRDLSNFEVIIQRRGKPHRFSYVLK